jgi:hypothetical protein
MISLDSIFNTGFQQNPSFRLARRYSYLKLPELFFIRNVIRIVFFVHLFGKMKTMNRITVISVITNVIVIPVGNTAGMG